MFRDSLDSVSVALFDRLLKSNDPTILAKRNRPWWYPWILYKRAANKAFVRLMNDYFNLFGPPQNIISYLESMRDYAYTVEQIIHGEKHLKANANIQLLEANKALEEGGEGSLLEATVAVSKHLGFKINAAETSMQEFYYLLKDLNNHGRKQA